MFDIFWFLAGLELLIAGGRLLLVQSLLSFDLGSTVAVAFACLSIFTGRGIARWGRGVFTGHRVAGLMPASHRHEPPPGDSRPMRGSVAPLTIVKLWLRPARP
jgi:hypothetical protein